jgi:hypothetical protein
MPTLAKVSNAISEPQIECLGVYVVPCDDGPWREELDNAYRSLGLLDETQEYRRRLLSIVLVQVMISAASASFDVGQFRQSMECAPDGYTQAVYDEALLSQDGTAVICRCPGCADGVADGRLCFFPHYYDPTRPIQWSFGEFTCPPPQRMPEWLTNLSGVIVRMRCPGRAHFVFRFGLHVPAGRQRAARLSIGSRPAVMIDLPFAVPQHHRGPLKNRLVATRQRTSFGAPHTRRLAGTENLSGTPPLPWDDVYVTGVFEDELVFIAAVAEGARLRLKATFESGV